MFAQFKARAEELSVRVLRASSSEQGLELLLAEIKGLGIKKAAAAPLTLVDRNNLQDQAAAEGIDLCIAMDRDLIEQADLGISEFDLGIAESGTLVQDASSLHSRLVSMLPPVHAALLSTSTLVPGFADALTVIDRVYNGEMPPFLSFISGPSKTADIEGVLTIGVHGPRRLVILCIDGEC